MTKFSIFEKTVEALYANVVPNPKEQCSKSTQLGVSFAAGYIAGILCAIVSHPADNLVSYLNNKKGAKISQVIKSPQNQLLLLLLPLSPYYHLDWILGSHPWAFELLFTCTTKQCSLNILPNVVPYYSDIWTKWWFWVQAISDLGIVALFTRGLPLRIVMIGTLTGAQWGIYDAFKVFVGL